MKKTIEVPVIGCSSNRNPIMAIVNNKVISLENLMKDVCWSHINIAYEPNWFDLRDPENSVRPVNYRKVDGKTAKKLMPYTKKMKITIEIEES